MRTIKLFPAGPCSEAMEAALDDPDGRERFPDFVLAELSQRYGSAFDRYYGVPSWL